MKPSTAILTTTAAALLLMGCASNNGNNGGGETAAKAELTEQQDSLMQHGWQMPATVTTGELTEQYGIRNRYGQQDNCLRRGAERRRQGGGRSHRRVHTVRLCGRELL